MLTKAESAEIKRRLGDPLPARDALWVHLFAYIDSLTEPEPAAHVPPNPGVPSKHGAPRPHPQPEVDRA